MIGSGARGGGRRGRPAGALIMCAALLVSSLAFAQHGSSHERTYPKEIRGYKVERAEVELKKPRAESVDAAAAPSLITLGEPKVTSISPLGVYLEVPVTVAAVKQGGRVDFLTFEDMVVNGTPVTVNEYRHPFELPNDRPVTLADPVTLYISTPRALFGALGEWSQPKEVWPVTGRVYVFGRFKKLFFTFKRVVPVELALSFRNPLRGKG